MNRTSQTNRATQINREIRTSRVAKTNRVINVNRWFVLFFAVLVLSLLMTACGSAKSGDFDPTADGVKIAVESGTQMETNVENTYPNAKIVHVDGELAGLLSVQTGKVDAYAAEQECVDLLIEKYADNLTSWGEAFGEPTDVSVAIAAKTSLPNAEQMINDFLKEMQEDGTLDDMRTRWIEEENYEMPEIPKPENPDKEITVATTGLLQPFTFIQEDDVSGFDVELAKRFALWANAEMNINIYDWSGVFSALGTDRVDYVFSHIYQSGEGRGQITFSDSYMTAHTILVVSDSNINTSGVSNSFKDSFYRNFISESRWKLFVQGMLTTVVITLLSLMFGTLLGALLCFGKRSRYRVLRNLLNGVTQVVQGIPVLIVLLLVYYVILTHSTPIVAAVVAFTINFGAYISDSMKGAVDGIDRGQWEAAEALGFTRANAMRKVIFPQVLRNLLPAYQSNAVAMLLLTSVVGYVSALDLTYAAQMIRNRTYDAFLPILMAGMIYLLLTRLLAKGVEAFAHLIQNHFRLITGVDRDREIHDFSPEKETESEGNTLISVSGLTKRFEQGTPIENLECEVKQGDVISIIGPSGTGKSTLLRCINHLETPTEGSVRLFGQEIVGMKPAEIAKLRRKVGMVFQHFNLFSHLTVIENIMLAPMLLKGVPKQEAYDYGMYLLRAVGMEDRADRYPDVLSGGQKQRVAIVRTLAMRPEIILFDEPTSALDPKMVDEILLIIRQLARQGMTMMIVTHELEFARRVSTKIFYMDQGVVLEHGNPKQVFEHPQTERCRIFVNSYKICNICLERSGVGFMESVEDLAEFTHKYYLSGRQTMKLNQVLEELCYLQLYRVLMPMDIPVDLYIEYHEQQTECFVRITYGGELWNPLRQEEKLENQIVLADVRQHQYTYSDNTNVIELIF